MYRLRRNPNFFVGEVFPQNEKARRWREKGEGGGMIITNYYVDGIHARTVKYSNLILVLHLYYGLATRMDQKLPYYFIT